MNSDDGTQGKGCCIDGCIARFHRAARLAGEGAGYLAHHQGDHAAACALHEQSVLLARQVGNNRLLARSLVNLGYLLMSRYRDSDAAPLAKRRPLSCPYRGAMLDRPPGSR
jgi:hypothetical protein